MLFKMRLSLAMLTVASAIQPSAAVAQDLERTERTLQMIAEQTDRICYKLLKDGKGSATEIQGRVNAEVLGLFKKLAGMGVDGALNYNDYEGLLQSDLSAAMQNQSQCQERVHRSLLERILPPVDPGALRYRPVQSTEANGLMLSLESCDVDGIGQVSCRMVIENRLAVRKLWLNNGRCCAIYDQRGSSGALIYASIANNSAQIKQYVTKALSGVLVPGVPTAMVLKFSSLGLGASSLSAINISVRIDNQNVDFSFANIKLGG